MRVREKCDEKSWVEGSGSWQCGIPAFAKCMSGGAPDMSLPSTVTVGPRLAPKEGTRTWGTGPFRLRFTFRSNQLL